MRLLTRLERSYGGSVWSGQLNLSSHCICALQDANACGGVLPTCLYKKDLPLSLPSGHSACAIGAFGPT